MNFQSPVEKQIQDAMERGDFDNLKGQGKPLPKEKPFVDYDTLAQTRLYENAGFQSPIDASHEEIERKLDDAILACERSWRQYTRVNKYGQATPNTERQWETAQKAFKDEIKQVNRLIRDHNLKISVSALHRHHVDAAKILQQIKDNFQL